MQSRRKFILGSTAAATLTQLSGCAGNSMAEYDKASAELRRPFPVTSDFAEYVRFATPAPSGHNTQPWHFRVLQNGGSILPDLSCRTPVVDPDDHHLFVSLGCAAENFLIAAAANGQPGAITFSNDPESRIDIDLAHASPQSDALFHAIPARQSTRSNYDGRAVSTGTLKSLEAAARISGVTLLIITDAGRREAVLDQLILGNSLQMEDPAFVQELRDWIRFNPSQALATGDGLFTRCSGQPTLPTWIGKRMFTRFFRKDDENARYTAQMRSSAGVAVFIGDRADRDHWVRVGRSFQRFALQATALGLSYALINQPVEVPSVRADFARWLGLGDTRPDLVVRFGAARSMPRSMRRPIRSVIIS